MLDTVTTPDNAKPRRSHQWDRADKEWYVEPEAATKALLTAERFVGSVWDPCCGQGNIVRTLIDGGYRAWGTDLVERVPGADWFSGCYDFLDRLPLELAPNIVMNPPFYRAKGTEAFIRRALDIAPGKVCAFTDTRFLAGDERASGLFAARPPSRVWIVTPRVSCPPGEYLAAGNKAGNGSSDWCWMVWDNSAPVAPPRIGWVRREARK